MKKFFCIVIASIVLSGCASMGTSGFEDTLRKAMISPEQAQSLVDQGVKSGNLTKSQGELIMQVAQYILKK